MATTGILITGFGGPSDLDSVRPFMCNLMGREPADELVERVCMRYLAIGGKSPLVEIAGAFAEVLQEELRRSDNDLPIALGMLYWDPYIEDGLTKLRDAGCDRVIVVSLSPFESKVAHGATRTRVEEIAGELGILEVVEAPLLSQLDAFTDFYAGATAVTLSDVENNEGLILAFTAHSLPEADLTDDDPYVRELKSAASDTALKLGLEVGQEDQSGPVLPGFSAYGSAAPPRAWFLVYQSKGQRPGSWLGPDLDELLDAAIQSNVAGVVVVPIGFATDHMETLYDLDIAAADKLMREDREFFRVPVVNDSETVIRALATELIPLIEN